MNLKNIISNIPDLPGCYIYRDINQNIIYVGKAKNLKKRVSSYFNKAQNAKTQKLVEQIRDIEYVITNNEKEALLLEVNLIKENNPKYNILLKDDKRYPYIKVTINDKYPKLLYTNRINADKSRYYGPFPSATAAKEVVELLEGYYPLRKCNNTEKRGCIYYHIGRCIGSCDHEVPREMYDKNIRLINDFFHGKYNGITVEIKRKMNSAVENLEFEKAQEYKLQLDYINELNVSQVIELNNDNNIDIIQFKTIEEKSYYYQLFIRNGRVLNQDFGQTDSIEELLITNYVINYNDQTPRLLITNNQDVINLFDGKINNTSIVFPQRGKKKELLELAATNLEEQIEKIFRSEKEQNAILNKVKTFIGIDSVKTIEFFDNSHISTTNYVAGKVVFINGKKEPQLYRKYNLQAKEEYDAMREVLTRRYSKLENDKIDLLIVDGGKGQLTIANEVFTKLEISNIKVIGLVKNEAHQTAAAIIDGKRKDFDDIELLRFFSAIQDEGHRYAVEFHRKKRSSSMKKSFIEEIKGIGPKKLQRIRTEYPTLEDLYYADYDNLRALGLNEEETTELMVQINRLYQQVQ
jgi:excinuclease ABC subunit C